MRYDVFRANGYDIGSGAVEGVCKNVVGKRLKQSGMGLYLLIQVSNIHGVVFKLGVKICAKIGAKLAYYSCYEVFLL
jgi:hypothetical protein